MLAAGKSDQTFGEIIVGGKIAGLTDNNLAPGALFQGGGHEFKQIDRGAVAGQNLARPGADQRGNPVADGLRHLHPAMNVPRLDQIVAPLLTNNFGQAGGHMAGQGTEGVAVQINDAVGQIKFVAHGCQGIPAIQRNHFVPANHHPPAFAIMSPAPPVCQNPA